MQVALAPRLTFVTGSALAMMLVWLGCADESSGLAVRQNCSLNSECSGSLVCAFGKCQQACRTTRDCQVGERCVQGSGGQPICQRQGCARNSECPGAQICAIDSQCRDACFTQKDCLPEQVCTGGVCAENAELVKGALPSVTTKAGVGDHCRLPTDCPDDLVCLPGGTCGPECIGDKDCLVTYTCKPLRTGGAARCVPPEQGVDASTSDAGTSDGALDTSSDASDGGVASMLVPGRVAASFYHVCAIPSPGKLKCWGIGAAGPLGYGDNQNRGDGAGEMGANLPFVDLGTGVVPKFVAVGQQATCVIVQDGRLKCFGANSVGQLGLGDTQSRGALAGQMGDALPYVDLGTGRTARSVSGQNMTFCAVLDIGLLKCWGENAQGQLGYGDTAKRGDNPNEMGDSLPFVALGTGRTVKSVAVAQTHACAILDNDLVKCWGFNGLGALGYGDTQNRGSAANQMGDNLPYVDLGTGRTAKAIGTGFGHSCALLDNDTVKCWGSALGTGVLGYGDGVSRGDSPNTMGDNLPAIDFGPGRTVKALSTAGQSACVTLDNDDLKCWGLNDKGQLGQGDTQNRGGAANQMGSNLLPVLVGTGKRARIPLTSMDVTCTVLDTGDLKCWGVNTFGQLGQGDTSTRGDGAGEMGDALPPIVVQ